jgi:hypothetical protein
MDPLHRPERRSPRYPLHLLVSLKLADDEIRVRSENISLGGILLSSAFLIPEGSTVELAILTRKPDTVPFLTGRGKVLRVQQKTSGDFAIAIQCDCPFRVVRHTET